MSSTLNRGLVTNKLRRRSIMNYTIATPYGTWKIEQDTQRNWVVLWLKRGDTAWQAVNVYYTLAGAAAAVAQGETTVAGWDETPRESEAFALSRWSEASHACE